MTSDGPSCHADDIANAKAPYRHEQHTRTTVASVDDHKNRKDLSRTLQFEAARENCPYEEGPDIPLY